MMKPEHIVYLISRIRTRANALLVRELERHHITGLSPSHGSILAMLSNGEPRSMRMLARLIDRKKSTVTALVDKLAEHGYVEKFKDAADQRITLVKLTDKGQALRPQLEEISHKLLETVYRGISEGEKQILLEILTKIKNNFNFF